MDRVLFKQHGLLDTGKSLSEALIFASTNPQYENRLFIELQVQYMKIPSSNVGRTCCVKKLFLTFNNMFSPCSAKRRASDKDLPVQWPHLPCKTLIISLIGTLQLLLKVKKSQKVLSVWLHPQKTPKKITNSKGFTLG